MRVSKSSFAAGALAALVLGTGSAYAATGGNFILGKSNAAGATTVLTNKNGTALALNAKAGTAPLKVSNRVRVPNLNADKLDGLDAGHFARSTMKAGSFDIFGTNLDVESFDDGTSLFYVVAECPLATVRTGGGYVDLTSSGVVLWNGPDLGNSWSVGILVDDTAGDTPDMVAASVTCLNPKGTAPAGSYRMAPEQNRLEQYKAATER